ncbi:MAG: hypothetical protein V1694_10545 [Candidatus Eisenbacteria bacterium]
MKEGAKKSLVTSDPSGVTLGSAPKLVDIEGRVVGQRVHLEVGPERLHGVELRGVGGKENRVDGATAATELGRGASMDVEAIPHEDDGRTEFSAERPDEAEKVLGHDIFVGQERKVKSHPASPGRDGERRDHRDALMGPPPLIKDGRLSHGGPGAAHQWGHEKPALIQEDERGFQPPGVFFIRGHWDCTQPRIAGSSRSRARRSGFWGLKPRDRSRRLMWWI